MNVVDTFSLPFTFLKVLGLCPFQYNKHGISSGFNTTTFSAVYSVIFIIIFAGYYLLAAVRVKELLPNNMIDMSSKIDSFYVGFTVIELTSIMVVNIVKRKNVIRFFEKIKHVDDMYLNKNVQIRYKFHQIIFTGYVLIVSLESAILEYFNCTMYLNRRENLSEFCWGLCTLSLLIQDMQESYFIILVWLLNIRFSILNSLTTSMSTQQSDEKRNLVIFVKKMHLELCEAGHFISDGFSLQSLLIIGCLFLNFTTNSFHMFRQIGSGNTYAIVTSGFWCMTRLIKLFIILVTTSLTKRKADSTINELFKEKSHADLSTTREIDSFWKQTLHWNINFSGCFFKLDMSLFFGILSSAATYLTILLQFDKTSEE